MIGKSNMEEDSVLLKQRSDEVRKISKQNSKEENWQIFREYYLWKSVLGLVIGVFLVWQIISIAFFNKRPAVSVMMMGVQIMMEEQESFAGETGLALGIDEKKEFVSITTDFKADMLVPLMAAGEIDVFLMDRSSFQQIAEEGFLMNLKDVEGLPEGELCYAQTEGEDLEQPYGLLVNDSAWLAQFNCMSPDDFILGVAANCDNLEMAEKLADLIK